MNKKISGNDAGIIMSIIGMIASIIVIVLNLIDHESITTGLVLLLACTTTLSTNVRNKKMNK